MFRGRCADQVRKFRDDIVHYSHAHQVEPSKQRYLKIASKYVHIRVTPLKGMKDPFGHPDTTDYHREVIRPYVRRSDPEWSQSLVIAAREDVLAGRIRSAHENVVAMLGRFDANHDTYHSFSYEVEMDSLFEDRAHTWEHLRLMSYYVQEIADYEFFRADHRLVDQPNRLRVPAKKTTRRKVNAR